MDYLDKLVISATWLSGKRGSVTTAFLGIQPLILGLTWAKISCTQWHQTEKAFTEQPAGKNASSVDMM